jgi:hypothetical protein
MRKRKNQKRNRSKGLFGTPVTAGDKQAIGNTLKEGGLILLSAIAAGGAGAAVGRHSLLVGLPVTLYGIYKNNKYITAAGLGFILSNGFQLKKPVAQTTEGIDGPDFKMLATEAKERVGTFFKNFGEKLYLPVKAGDATNGLGEDDEQVTYFVNPHSKKELDMSAIDRIQEQIADMSKPMSGNLNEMDREF